jgi:aryl-alcohol dehydrogenase-like predicted oxidoreductase
MKVVLSPLRSVENQQKIAELFRQTGAGKTEDQVITRIKAVQEAMNTLTVDQQTIEAAKAAVVALMDLRTNAQMEVEMKEWAEELGTRLRKPPPLVEGMITGDYPDGQEQRRKRRKNNRK